jgi:hypothetical protein
MKRFWSIKWEQTTVWGIYVSANTEAEAHAIAEEVEADEMERLESEWKLVSVDELDEADARDAGLLDDDNDSKEAK